MTPMTQAMTHVFDSYSFSHDYKHRFVSTLAIAFRAANRDRPRARAPGYDRFQTNSKRKKVTPVTNVSSMMVLTW